MSATPVLLPPTPQRPRPLPAWLAGVAVLGLALLFLTLVPAVFRHARLSRDLRRLHTEVERQERQVRALERSVRAAQDDTFAYERALRDLLHPPGEAGR